MSGTIGWEYEGGLVTLYERGNPTPLMAVLPPRGEETTLGELQWVFDTAMPTLERGGPHRERMLRSYAPGRRAAMPGKGR